MSTRVPPPGLTARTGGWCELGDDEISRGDRIVYRLGRPIHVTCANGTRDIEEGE